MDLNNRQKLRGFTLIEVMITVVIVAILAALAIPAYQESVQKSRRSEARALLTKGAQEMERKFTANPSTGYAWTANDIWTASEQGNAFYTLAVAAGTSSTFSITATPKNAQVSDKCGTFALNQLNVKSVTPPSGSTLTITDCWPD